ncbi:MAG: Stage V sporulation protein D [Firmicutes bacterium ADurb.Bin193]|nr:MAG: Stage V sporulation protein D [Firmicutes bacterium ADurb.Bin193]
MLWNKIGNRYTVIFAVIAIMTVAITSRLFSLQIVKGDYYREQSENRLIRSMPIKAPRGEIHDKYGRPFITNRQGFSIIFQKEWIKPESLNSLILRVIGVTELYGETYIDTFPVTKEYPFAFYFPEYQGEQLERRIAEFKRSKGIDEVATAEQTVAFFAQKYGITDSYTPDELRKIVGVRYEMENRLFSNTTPYTFATDVGIACVTHIKEHYSDFSGIVISVEPIREYTNGTLAAHLLGRVGIMYKEEYEQLKSKNYSINDTVGKDGIEKILEEYLRGTDGVSSVEQSIDGKMSRVLESKPAKPGNYAVLTLDARLQSTLESSLDRVTANLRRTARGRGATAGSGVVLDVNTGEVLAMASYPTFDPSKFNELWGELNKDPNRPMWNRAISGQYAPGSTFKVLSAIAALESGAVTPKEGLVCDGVYDVYASSGYAPVCWIYTSSGRGHGTQNVTQALENSCNLYFYEVGRRMGIDVLSDFGAKFGLGEYTGIEIAGEAKGIFASRAYRERLGRLWYPGDMLQAAIGQSDHLFTPIQIANYIATIANGGKRYKPHLIKSVKSYTDATTIFETTPEVVDEIEIDPVNYRAVMDGMRRVSETGTASSTFVNFEIPVGGKTGSASVPSGEANGLFVAFAPFDDPQIAVAIVVEHAGSGSAIAEIARDVIREYMSVNAVEDQIQPYNELVR